MPSILVIAYGNRLRSDDGLAWFVAEQLSQLDLPEEVEILTCHQLAPELAVAVSQASSVLFLDASRTGAPGEVVSTQITETSSSLFTHDFSPAAILRAAKDLYGGCPDALALSLVGECFDHGENLTPKVKERLPNLVTLAHEWIRKAALRSSAA